MRDPHTTHEHTQTHPHTHARRLQLGSLLAAESALQAIEPSLPQPEQPDDGSFKQSFESDTLHQEQEQGEEQEETAEEECWGGRPLPLIVPVRGNGSAGGFLEFVFRKAADEPFAEEATGAFSVQPWKPRCPEELPGLAPQSVSLDTSLDQSCVPWSPWLLVAPHPARDASRNVGPN